MIKSISLLGNGAVRLSLCLHSRRSHRLISTNTMNPNRICIFAPSSEELDILQDHFKYLSEPLLAPDKQPCLLDFHSDIEKSSLRDHDSNPDQNPPTCGSFNAHEYFSALKTATLGKVLFTAPSTPSTQTFIQENITKLPNGVVFTADKQYGGKGRGGNVWESPQGCLMFSTCYHLSIEGQRLPFVQYLATLAVLQAVQAETSQFIAAQQHMDNSNTNNNTNTNAPPPSLPSSAHIKNGPLDLKIKWPNDIYSDTLKIAGVLCHSSFRQGMFHVIIGVGLNLANEKPTTCIDSLVQQHLAERLGHLSPPVPLKTLSKEALLANILTRLESMLHRVSESGFQSFESEYYNVWMHSNQRVMVEDAVDSSKSTSQSHEERKKTSVVIRGLSDHGYLLAEDDFGVKYELHPDGNSFDFLQGLVRKKM